MCVGVKQTHLEQQTAVVHVPLDCVCATVCSAGHKGEPDQKFPPFAYKLLADVQPDAKQALLCG